MEVSEMTFLSEKLERLEQRNLTRRRRVSVHAWNHAIEVLAERVGELDRQAVDAITEQERRIAGRLKVRLDEVRERIQELTDRLKEVGKDPERKQLADPYMRQIRAAQAAEREADQRWRLAMVGATAPQARPDRPRPPSNRPQGPGPNPSAIRLRARPTSGSMR